MHDYKNQKLKFRVCVDWFLYHIQPYNCWRKLSAHSFWLKLKKKLSQRISKFFETDVPPAWCQCFSATHLTSKSQITWLSKLIYHNSCDDHTKKIKITQKPMVASRNVIIYKEVFRIIAAPFHFPYVTIIATLCLYPK